MKITYKTLYHWTIYQVVEIRGMFRLKVIESDKKEVGSVMPTEFINHDDIRYQIKQWHNHVNNNKYNPFSIGG